MKDNVDEFPKWRLSLRIYVLLFFTTLESCDYYIILYYIIIIVDASFMVAPRPWSLIYVPFKGIESTSRTFDFWAHAGKLAISGIVIFSKTRHCFTKFIL